MNVSRVLCAAAVALTVLCTGSTLRAQQPATGTIEGRVQNVVTGVSLNNARVTVKGTTTMTFTDEGGVYRLTDLPAGPTTVRVFFTGLDEMESTVNVVAGQTVQQDFNLTSKARYGAETDTIKLDAFVVSSTKETNAAAIAVQEQRFAANMKSVVSSDEFGTLVDRNPGELLKYLPGVDVESFANNITGVSVRGLGSNNTELNFDGMSVASMNAESVGRGFEVQYASAADIARVEIKYVPLPEDSANSLGGSINMVRRSAFEYSKRKIDYRVMFLSDGEKFTLKKMDGPKDRGMMRWRPNWEVAWTEPVNKNLGFAVTVGQNDVLVNTHWSLPGWDTGSSTNDAAYLAAKAAGLPYTSPSLYNPGMRNPLNHNAPKNQGKGYASVRADWRPTSDLTLSASISGTDGWVQNADDIRYQWDNSATGSGDRERYADQHTSLGRIGGGEIYHNSPLWRDVYSPAITEVVTALWKKNDWTVSSKASLSESRYNYSDTKDGFFGSTSVGSVTGLTNIPETGVGYNTANPIPLTINYYDINYWGPKRIESLTTANGLSSTNLADYSVPVDWSKNANIRIGGARARPGWSKEIITSEKTFVKRDFNFKNPFSLQAGLDYSERYRNRHYWYDAWRFVGPDGIGNTADDNALQIAAVNVSSRRDSQYDYPAIDRISMTRLYKLYQDHPEYFQYDQARSARLSITSQAAYDMTEKVTAPYLQFDSQFLHNRLRLTGGLRYEKSEADATGLLHTQSNAYQKYSNGLVKHASDIVDPSTGLPYKDATGAYKDPTGKASVGGTPVYLPGVTTGSLAETALTYVEKGATGHGANHVYSPSLHVSYNITDNLVFQIAYAKLQSKLDFANVIIPSNDVTDTLVTSGNGTGALGTINIRNPNLKPEVIDTYDARLSYYNKTGGMVGLAMFLKHIKNFQVALSTPPMSAQDLAVYEAQFPDSGIGPQYAGYSISTRFNGGAADLTGGEFELRQSLDPFVPSWAKGFMIRASSIYSNRSGQNAGDLGNDRAWRDTVSVNYNARKVSFMVGYNMNGTLIENANLTTNNIAGKQVLLRQNLVDFNFTYRLRKGVNLFVAGSNIFNALRAREQQTPGRPDWSRMTSSNTFGKTYTIGVTGSF